MGVMAYSLLWVMQDFVHQPYGVRLVLITGHNLAGPKQFISDTRKTPRVQEPLIQEHAFSYRKKATIIQGIFLAGLGVTGLWGLKAQEL